MELSFVFKSFGVKVAFNTIAMGNLVDKYSGKSKIVSCEMVKKKLPEIGDGSANNCKVSIVFRLLGLKLVLTAVKDDSMIVRRKLIPAEPEKKQQPLSLYKDIPDENEAVPVEINDVLDIETVPEEFKDVIDIETDPVFIHEDVPIRNEYEYYEEPEVEWKVEIERDFKDWLSALKDRPEVESREKNTPDIYTFYEQLTAITNEIRKGTRKSSESLIHFEGSIEVFLKSLADIDSRIAKLESEKDKDLEKNVKQLIMTLVEVSERICRVGKSVIVPPKKVLFGYNNQLKQIIKNTKKGVEILSSHVERLLLEKGVVRIKTVGEQFDPTKMIAIVAEVVNNVPVDFVAEEFSPGYIFNENVLKFAEVKVSKKYEGK